MGISKSMTGTPWHTQGMYRQEGDPRRYKGRCKYYSYSTDFCNHKKYRCPWSAHCDYYEEISDEEFTKRQLQNQKKMTKKTGEDNCYWY